LIHQEQVHGYQPYWAARADLLGRVGAILEARRAYERAIALSKDDAVRRFLQRRMEQMISPSAVSHISNE
jgi:predicted RNA polymerase sigma factor